MIVSGKFIVVFGRQATDEEKAQTHKVIAAGPSLRPEEYVDFPGIDARVPIDAWTDDGEALILDPVTFKLELVTEYSNFLRIERA